MKYRTLKQIISENTGLCLGSLLLATPALAQQGEMMQMHWAAAAACGIGILLLLILVVLGIAALVKYLRSDNKRP